MSNYHILMIAYKDGRANFVKTRVPCSGMNPALTKAAALAIAAEALLGPINVVLVTDDAGKIKERLNEVLEDYHIRYYET